MKQVRNQTWNDIGLSEINFLLNFYFNEKVGKKFMMMWKVLFKEIKTQFKVTHLFESNLIKIWIF
jgi:hypothetical protein